MTSSRWLKLTVAYDGAQYAGWQWQPNEPTVQGKLQEAWQQLTGEQPNLTASGRTDSGVHALGQVIGIETLTTLTDNRLQQGLNALLPEDIVVREVVAAPVGFHATHDALRKTYRYQIHNSRTRPLMDRHYVWHVRAGGLDADRMRAGGGHLVGRHDFAALETTGSERSSTIRTITELRVVENAQRIDIEVTGDGFLYNMVRTIAGTLVEVGRGAQEPDWVAEVLASRDRAMAGPTAPAAGLLLLRVEY